MRGDVGRPNNLICKAQRECNSGMRAIACEHGQCQLCVRTGKAKRGGKGNSGLIGDLQMAAISIVALVLILQ